METNSNSDVDSYLKNVECLMRMQNVLKKENEELKIIINHLRNQLQIIKDSEQFHKNHLENICKTFEDKDCLITEHITLKEEYKSLENEYIDLKKKYDFVQLNFEAEKDKLRKNYEGRAQVLKDSHANEIKHLNESLSYQKYQFQEKEDKFNESLQVMQNKAALEYDLMESHLNKSLEEANIKLRELNNANSTLRSEIFSLKNRFSFSDYEESKKKIQELEKKLQELQEQSSSSQNYSPENIHIPEKELPSYPHNSRNFSAQLAYSNHNNYKENTGNEKYQALNITSTFYRHSRNNDSQNYLDKYQRKREKNYLPPLIKLPSEGFQKTSNKKRKLYNPEEGEYYN